MFLTSHIRLSVKYLARVYLVDYLVELLFDFLCLGLVGKLSLKMNGYLSYALFGELVLESPVLSSGLERSQLDLPNNNKS